MLRISCTKKLCAFAIAQFVASASHAQQPAVDPAVQQALRMLRSPDWSDKDPWIQRLKDLNAESGRGVGGKIEHEIEEREVQSLSLVLSAASLDNDQKVQVLRECADHPHARVRYLAAWQLLVQGKWDENQALIFARRENTLGAWNAIIPGIRVAVPRERALPMAADAIAELLKSPDPSDANQIALLNESVRILSASSRQTDRDLLLQAVRQFPDEPLVWMAVSRYPVDPAVTAMASTIYGDERKSITLRCAAGLVVARNHGEVGRRIAEYVVEYAQKFAGPGYMDDIMACYRNPRDPECQEQSRLRQAGSGLAGVLFELPEEVLLSFAEPLCRYHGGDIGLQTSAVLALRIPGKFMDEVADYAAASEEVQRALLLLSLEHPSQKARAEQLIPPDKLTGLRAGLEKSDRDSFLAGRLAANSLWD